MVLSPNEKSALLSLETFLIPHEYRISLDFFEKFEYTGEVEIDGVVDDRFPDTLQLHSKGHQITSVSLTHGKDKHAASACQINDDVVQFTTTTGNPWNFPKGDQVTLHVKFSAKVQEGMAGLYRVKFEDDDGKEIQNIASQCEPAGARIIFPCVDDPSAKAIFSFTVKAETSLSVISNTKLKSRHDEGKWSTHHFKPTPVMSTYLSALLLGKYHKTSLTTSKGIEMNFYVEKASELKYVEFAKNIAPKCVEYFEEKFGIEYPLEKLDFVSLSQFEAGAMENWGLITFRKSALLVTPETDRNSQRGIAAVVAHEIAHQWFGNLVTMKWWDDLWLNEGFATEMMYRASDAVMPELFFEEGHIRSRILLAFFADSLKSSHPISVPVKNVQQISEVFDAISYNKGCATIRMLTSYLSQQVFDKGVSHYLKSHAYSNANLSEFIGAIGKVSGMSNLAQIMDKWLTVANYPIVHAEKVGKKLRLTQRPFLRLSSVQSVDKKGFHWHIPMNVKVLKKGKAHEVKSILFPDTTSMELEMEDDQQWMILNHDCNGFYLVTYSAEFYEQIEQFADQLSDKDLFSVVLSYFMIVVSDLAQEERYSHLSVLKLMKMMVVLKPRMDPLPQTLFADLMRRFCKHYKASTNSSFKQKFSELFDQLYKEDFDRAVSPKQPKILLPANKDELRTQLVKTYALYHPQEASEKFSLRFHSLEKAQSELIEPYAMSMMMTDTSQEKYDSFIQFAKATPDPSIKNKVYASLGLNVNPEVRKKIFQSIFDGQIELMNASIVAASFGISPEVSNEWLEYLCIEERVSKLIELLPGMLLSRVLLGGFSSITDVGKMESLVKLFEGKKHSANMAMLQLMENVKINKMVVDSLK